jgi:ABC-2 type transport system permease protein
LTSHREAEGRDGRLRFGSIIRSTPITKFDYLYGRYLGALIAAALGMLSIPAGLLLGSLAPWVDHETLGPLTLAPYVYAYLALALPILFLTSALYFALTTVTRSMMWTYVGLVVLMVFRSVFSVVVSKPGLEHIAAVWEPFGASAFAAATHYWTASERNVLTPAITGDTLLNKAIWLAVAAGLLTLAYRLFDFQAAELSGRRKRRSAAAGEPTPQTEAGPAKLAVLAKPRFNGATTRAQVWARTKLDAAQVFKSPAYFVLLGLAGLLSLFNLWLATDIGAYGGKIHPVTRVMVDALTGIFTFFTMVIAVYYAGELVWRERERRTQEIIDATPVPDWMFIAPKTAAISLVLISTLVIAVAVAIATQAVRGYFDFEIGHYLLWYVLPSAIDMTLLAVFIQALSPNKYAGWAVMVVFLHTRRPAVGHERHGPVLDRRLLVPALLERVRGRAAGAGLWVVETRDGDPVPAAPAPPASPTERRRGRHSGGRPGGVRRVRKLDLLQHQHPQPVPHQARRRKMGGGL